MVGQGRDFDTTLGRARHGWARPGGVGQGRDLIQHNTTNHRSTAQGPLTADPRCE